MEVTGRLWCMLGAIYLLFRFHSLPWSPSFCICDVTQCCPTRHALSQRLEVSYIFINSSFLTARSLYAPLEWIMLQNRETASSCTLPKYLYVYLYAQRTAIHRYALPFSWYRNYYYYYLSLLELEWKIKKNHQWYIWLGIVNAWKKITERILRRYRSDKPLTSSV